MTNYNEPWNKRQMPSKEQLEADRLNLSEKAVIKKYKVSKALIHRWYHRLGIEKKPKKVETQEITCMYCRKVFVAKVCAKRKFCSKSCGTLYRDTSGKNNPMYGKPAYNRGRYTKSKEARCLTCGKTFRYFIGRGLGKYCSMACRGIAFRGANNLNWTGGFRYYYGYDWCKIREMVRKRDYFKCQKCGMSNEECIIEFGCQLHVHHMLTFRKTKRNKLEELVSLCPVCHIEEDILIRKQEIPEGRVAGKQGFTT